MRMKIPRQKLTELAKAALLHLVRTRRPATRACCRSTAQAMMADMHRRHRRRNSRKPAIIAAAVIANITASGRLFLAAIDDPALDSGKQPAIHFDHGAGG